MLRIKNEERWISKTLQSLEDICDSIVILDDGSQDNTVKICEEFEKVVEIHKQSNLPTDASRDKNILLEMAKKRNPNYILTLDGDEVIVPNSKDILFEELDLIYPDTNVFEFQFFYIWDIPNQYRYDGYYSHAWHGRLLRMNDQPMNLHYGDTGYAGNGHSPGVPQNSKGLHESVRSKIKILHYGNYDEELRQKKFTFYNLRDPHAKEFDFYKHIISDEGTHSGPYGMEFRTIPEGMYCSFTNNNLQ